MTIGSAESTMDSKTEKITGVLNKEYKSKQNLSQNIAKSRPIKDELKTKIYRPAVQPVRDAQLCWKHF